MTTLQVFICLKIGEILGLGILPYLLGRLVKLCGFDSKRELGMPYWICGLHIYLVLAMIMLFITSNWEIAKMITRKN